MAPGTKRKRGDRTYSHDSSDGRPSPHRPEHLSLAQHQQYPQHQHQHQHQQNQHQQHGYGYSPGRGGRGRGGYRGGRGGGMRHADSNGPPHSPSAPAASSPRVRESPVTKPPVEVATPTPAPQPTPASPPPAPAAAPAAASPPPPQTPPEPPGLFYYEYLTDGVVEAWEESGKASVVEAAVAAQAQGSYVALSTIFQELLRAGLDGRIDAAAAGQAVKQFLEGLDAEDAQMVASTFLDTLSVMPEADTNHPQLRTLVLATNIPAALMREQLEEPLLRTLDLIRPTFPKMFIRKQTNLLYRQSNYNLLREETEGYSKLVTELFTTTSNEPPSGEVVADTFENITALIGAFDLDAGRVLDVTMDVFASVLVKHFRFFVKFLRAGSWWPQHHALVDADHQILSGLPAWAHPDHSSWMLTDDEKAHATQLRTIRDTSFWEHARRVGTESFFTLGDRRPLSPDDAAAAVEAATDPAMQGLSESQRWIHITKTLPPLGNRTAAQLLGFKLRFYASDARDAQDVFPVNLIYLCALLIKIGFISLVDLYPHLFPADDAMAAVKEKQMQEKAERERAKRPGGGAANALMTAGALSDDTLPAPVISRVRENEARGSTPARTDPATASAATPEQAADADDKEQLPAPHDQKVQLLRSLLCIGALPDALYLLGRHPWLLDAFPDLPEHLHRILHHSLAHVYQTACPVNDNESLRTPARTAAYDQTGLPKGDIRLTDSLPPKILRWAQLDKNDVDGIDYRFYWDDWTDNVPQCQTVDDVFVLCSTLLNFSGVKIGQDPALLIKLARIGKHSLATDASEANRTRWLDLCRRLLVPALSLTKANPGAVNEVYDLLQHFSTQTRFSIYAEWFTGQVSRLPDIKTAFDYARLETKDVLRRVSKTNTKQMARSLAKIACASPGVVFAATLSQLEAYDNFIEVIVECGRYFTDMGYDVLTWSIMSALGRAGRERIATDGISTSGWLIALAKFVGRIYKRYSHMNPLPILQYLLEQVRQNNFTDLRVLRELIFHMAGIAADTNFTDSQVQSMAGGPLLRAQTLIQLMDTRHDDKENKHSARRLLRSIADGGLAGQLLVSIAQERQMCIFNPKQPSLKVIGENFDDIHVILSQYLDMLRHNLSTKDFDDCIPDIVSLTTEYGLEPSVAFTVYRESISQAMDDFDANAKDEEKKLKSLEAGDADVDLEMGEAAELPAKTNGELAEPEVDKTSEVTQTDATGESAQAEANGETAQPDKPNEEANPWHPILATLVDKIQPALPEGFAQNMSLPFFITFWQLSLHDMSAPSTSYNEEIERQKSKLQVIRADRSDVSVAGARKKDESKKRINDVLEGLKDEMKAHIQRYTAVRHRLQREKDHWFALYKGRPHVLNARLLQDCFLPRLLLSPLDAYFSFKMLFFLHAAGTVNFNTMHFIDKLLAKHTLAALIFQCTAREAENLGRFLFEVLRELSTWHAAKKMYEKKAWGLKQELAGFAKTIKEGKPSNFLDFEDYRRLFYKWHQQLHMALTSCLSGGEYMHIKNAITVLKCVQKYFPVVNWMAKNECDVILGLTKTERESREDLWVAANSLYGSLKSREKDWVLPQSFYISNAPHDPHRSTSRAGSTQPKPSPGKTPQPLNAAAAAFQPASAAPADQPLSARSEVEDGEVKDGGGKAAVNGVANKSTVSDTPKAETIPAQPKNARDAAPKAETRPAGPAKSENPRSTPGQSPAPRTHGLPEKPDVPPQRTLRSRINDTGRSDGRLDRPAELLQQRQQREARTGSPGRGLPRDEGTRRHDSHDASLSRSHVDTSINPERAARLGPTARDDAPSRPLRAHEPIRSTRSSRTSSPNRRDTRPARDDGWRDDRPPTRSMHERDRPTDTAPSGPRGSRMNHADDSRVPDSMHPPLSRGPSDYGHGRTSHDYARPARHQESTYGRLNQDTGYASSSNASPPSNLPRDGPPTRRSGPSSSSAPSTPATERAAPALGGVHPDRLNIIDPSASGPGAVSISTQPSNPPSGPRAASTTVPSPSTRGPPPPSTGGPDRRHEARQLAGLQATLQQGSQSAGQNDRGTSIRGRAAGSGSNNNNTSTLPPSNGPRYGPSTAAPSRDADMSRSSAAAPPDRTRERDRDRDRERDRPYRSTRNSSPGPPPLRERMDYRERDGRGERDRRSGGWPGEREVLRDRGSRGPPSHHASAGPAPVPRGGMREREPGRESGGRKRSWEGAAGGNGGEFGMHRDDGDGGGGGVGGTGATGGGKRARR